MDNLRKPFFIAALILMLLVVLIEIGSGLTLRGIPPQAADVMDKLTSAPLPAPIQQALGNIGSDQSSKDAVASLSQSSHDIPGYGIPYMAVLDGMLLFTVGLVASSLLITDQIQGRVQGCVTLILSIIMIIATIAMIILAIVFLILMISLLLAIPFGTIVYLAIYGFFNRGGASATLSLLMLLKIVFAVCLVVAQQRFLENRGLVLLIISSLIANIIVSFLQGFVPGILVSITDDIAGIVVAICGAIWWVLALIGAIPAILNAIRARV
jgi:hypothetical protein